MKHLILVSFLLTTSLLLPSDAASNAAVFDVDGHEVRPGVEYYILPVVRGRGGGLTLGSHSNTTTCPLYVGQESSEVNRGFRVTFTPVDPNGKIVQLSTDLNVRFSAATICVQSTVWRLGDVEGVSGRRYVTAGGVEGNPGVGTVSDWFKIERFRGFKDYKLVFCPSVCEFCKVVCGDIGVFVDGGKRWLGLGGMPLPVMFKRK
ncbi:kunitz trypsin inhibitor 5-like [Typha angustifolia]|uniref:kunitz trypsin inhibitor 5-like n=1 Tax=Typha angustifolia TaxID=59011 RepID=UPI003C2D4720